MSNRNKTVSGARSSLARTPHPIPTLLSLICTFLIQNIGDYENRSLAPKGKIVAPSDVND